MEIIDLREMMKAYTQLEQEVVSDQNNGLEQPPMDKAYVGAKTISLPTEYEGVRKNHASLALLAQR